MLKRETEGLRSKWAEGSAECAERFNKRVLTWTLQYEYVRVRGKKRKRIGDYKHENKRRDEDTKNQGCWHTRAQGQENTRIIGNGNTRISGHEKTIKRGYKGIRLRE